MKYSFIFHPKYQKYISLKSNLGRKLIKNYLNIILGGKKTKVYAPKTYFNGLSSEQKKKRLKRIIKGSKSDHKDPKSYKKFETDYKDGKLIKTKPSKYTKQWKTIFPDANSLKSKSKVTGVPLKIIKKIYNKGMAAWRTGHRPGANQQQWGYARVHSFLVKGKTFYTADKSLAKEALKNKKALKWFNSVEGLCDNPSFKKKNKWCSK